MLHRSREAPVPRWRLRGQEEEEEGAVLGFNSELLFGSLGKSNFNKVRHIYAHLE